MWYRMSGYNSCQPGGEVVVLNQPWGSRMEYLGHTQTATYMTGPRLGGSNTQTFLPSISTMQSSYKAFDNAAAPSPLRRSLTTMPWRPSTYYQTARVNPSSAVVRSMPDPMSAKNQLSELDSIKVPPVFAAARNALYTRYTPNDWMNSNQGNYLSSDKVRSTAERLRLDTVRLCRETDDKTRRTQSDVGKRLGERIGDIAFWKTELSNETDNMMAEINALQEAKRVLEKALQETENPLHISQECLYHREKRQGIDLVHDNPERELIKEVDIIKRCQERMRNTIDKANTQLGLCRAAQHELEMDEKDKTNARTLDEAARKITNNTRGIAFINGIEKMDMTLNRAAQHELEKDTGDKFVAQSLDETCHGLRNSSRGIAYHNGVDRVDNTVSVPESWAQFSNNNIQRSQSERAASKNMRHEIESVLNSCANEMWQEWNAVNVALTQRMQETTDTRNKLQTHLSKVLQEIFDMEKNIEFLKKAIQDKEAPMQVAQTRLDTRIRRPNVELCRDPVQHRLVEEVSEITETVESLQAKLRQAENSLQHLLRTKASLEQDLSIKNNSLFIDREKCLGMRKTFPMSPRVVSL